MSLPLSNMRVLELGHALAGPFAAVMLADFGAQVVKVEKPGVGDSLRAMGPQARGDGLWWSVTGRNKHSVCIDLKSADGLNLLRQIAATCDVVVENFRPGVLDRLGLGYEDLKKVKPDLVMLSVSGYGQTGPYSRRGGFGKIAEAYSGATHLTGAADEPPVHPGYSLGDATTGLMGAFGILLAIHHRDQTGEGQRIDLALYEPLLRMIEWQVPLYDHTGAPAGRNGPVFPFDGAFITDICRTKDDEAIVVSAATTQSLDSLRGLLRRAGLLADDSANEDGVVAALREWVCRLPRDEAITGLHDAGVVAGEINTAANIVSDPHIVARDNLVTVPDRGASVRMPAPVPMMSATPGSVRWAGPRLGQHTDEVLGDLLGLNSAEIADLRSRGIVA